MRAAVLSDIHANLPALEAVLDEPDVVAADAVVLLGDIALGPMPAETLDRLGGGGGRGARGGPPTRCGASAPPRWARCGQRRSTGWRTLATGRSGCTAFVGGR